MRMPVDLAQRRPGPGPADRGRYRPGIDANGPYPTRGYGPARWRAARGVGDRGDTQRELVEVAAAIGGGVVGGVP